MTFGIHDDKRCIQRHTLTLLSAITADQSLKNFLSTKNKSLEIRPMTPLDQRLIDQVKVSITTSSSCRCSRDALIHLITAQRPVLAWMRSRDA